MSQTASESPLSLPAVPSHPWPFILQPPPDVCAMPVSSQADQPAPAVAPSASASAALPSVSPPSTIPDRLSARCPICAGVFAYSADLVSSPTMTTADVMCPICRSAVKLPPTHAATLQQVQQSQRATQPTRPIPLPIPMQPRQDTLLPQQLPLGTFGPLQSHAFTNMLSPTNLSFLPPPFLPPMLQTLPVPPHLFLAAFNSMHAANGGADRLAVVTSIIHGKEPSEYGQQTSTGHCRTSQNGPNDHMSLFSHNVSGVYLHSERLYYEALAPHVADFDLQNSALSWLTYAVPSRTWKLSLPRSHRIPRSVAGLGGYCTAFQDLGLQLRDSDTSTGHWHSWFADPKLVSIKPLQAALLRRFKESSCFHEKDETATAAEGPVAAVVRTHVSARMEDDGAGSDRSSASLSGDVGTIVDAGSSCLPAHSVLSAQAVTQAFASFFREARGMLHGSESSDQPAITSDSSLTPPVLLLHLPACACSLSDGAWLECIRAARLLNAKLPVDSPPTAPMAVDSSSPLNLLPTSATALPTCSVQSASPPTVQTSESVPARRTVKRKQAPVMCESTQMPAKLEAAPSILS
jgi:hypothetical protein